MSNFKQHVDSSVFSPQHVITFHFNENLLIFAQFVVDFALEQFRMELTGLILIIFVKLSTALRQDGFKNLEFTGNICELQNVSSTSELNDIFANFPSSVLLYQDSYRSYGSRSQSTDLYLQQFVEFSCKNVTFKKLPHLLFQKFSNLQKFSAVEVQLEEINRDELKSSDKLKILDLSKNKISRLENLNFLHCKSLEEINLSKNEISWIHDNAFEGMSSKLKTVKLNFNKITIFKEEFFKLLMDSSKQLWFINLSDNKIKEIVKSNLTFDTKLTVNHLHISNNQLKIFDLPNIEIDTLKLDQNKIETLSFNGSVNKLYVMNNMLKELSVGSGTEYVSAETNKITQFRCDNNSVLENLFISGNPLGNDILRELKNAKKLNNLDLSETLLDSLSVDSFAEFESLKELRLDRNAITLIDYGLFAHQKNLELLDLSFNSIVNIDLHVLATMTSLRELHLSGNKIAKIDNYEDLHRILPTLETIGLEENNWNCEYLSKLKISLLSQNITIVDAVNPVKNETSISGIRCVTSSTETLSHVKATADDDRTAQKINNLVDKINEINARVNEVERNKTNFKELILSLQKDILILNAENTKNKISTLNATNSNEIRIMVEHLNNMTLQKQKLANDQLLQKINEQNVEISKYKMETEKLLMDRKVEGNSVRSEPQASQSIRNDSTGLNATDLFLAVIFAVLVTSLIILGVIKLKKFFLTHMHQMARQRNSRRNSVNTIITFDNSSVQ